MLFFPGCSSKLNEGGTETFLALCSLAVYSLKKLAVCPCSFPRCPPPPGSHPMRWRARPLPLFLVVRLAVPRLVQFRWGSAGETVS